MTKVLITDKDYEILNKGDLNEIKRLVNDIRTELEEAKEKCAEPKKEAKDEKK